MITYVWQGNRLYCQTKQKSEKKNETKFTYSPLCASIYELFFNIKDNDWIFPANEFWELNRISTWQQRIYRGTMLGLQVPLPHSFWAKDFFLACRNILKKDPVLKLIGIDISYSWNDPPTTPVLEIEVLQSLRCFFVFQLFPLSCQDTFVSMDKGLSQLEKRCYKYVPVEYLLKIH